MKKVFAASLCQNGLHGGGIYLRDGKMTYQTGKVSLSNELRKIEMPFSEIAEIRKKRRFAFSVFTVIPRSGVPRKFLVFAGERFARFLAALGEGDKIKA